MDNLNDPNLNHDRNFPAPHQEEAETFEDVQSTPSNPSSAGALNMTQMENRLENEMVKMAKMLTTQIQQDRAEVREEMNCKINNLTTGLLSSKSLGSNTQSSLSQTNQNNSTFQANSSNSTSDYFAPPLLGFSQSRGGNVDNLPNYRENARLKIKPQNFSGENCSDFEEYLDQFELTCEINNWDYMEKSLYLANSLTGEARSILSELDFGARRDYKALVEKLTLRYGSVNKSEIYRSQLTSRVKNKIETIPQLATAVKKLVKQAYPSINPDAVETLALDNFMDALPDSDIRFRVRELGPKTLAKAEQIAVRIDSHKIADKQRSLFVSRLDYDEEPEKQSPDQKLDILIDLVASLASYVQNLTKFNNNSANQQNSHWKGNQRNRSIQSHSNAQNRGNNSYQHNNNNRNSYQDQNQQRRNGPQKTDVRGTMFVLIIMMPITIGAKCTDSPMYT